MKIRKLILFVFFMSLIASKSISDDIEFEASKMEIEDGGNIIIAYDSSSYVKSEKIEIKSNKAKYDKKQNIIIYTGNVYFNDLPNNIEIRSNRVTYNKNKNLVYSSGTTTFIVDENYNIDTKNVYYDRNLSNISSDENTIILDNENNTYNLKDKFDFNTEKEIIKSKKSIIKDNNDNEYIFEDLIINLKNNEIAGKEIKVDFKNNYFGNNKNDPILKGRSSYSNNDELKIYKAVFSTCNTDNKKCRGWELNSEEFKHDKNQKLFEYKKSWLKIFDYKLFYLPYFNHPDPTVKRKSGFLTPSYSSSDSLGTSINFPYFKVLDVDKDLTFSPRYYADKSFLLQNEYRQELKNSSIVSDFSFLIGEAGTKGHLFYNQIGNLNEQLSYEFNIQNIKDDNYLKTYKLVDTSPIINDDNLLKSNFDFDWTFEQTKLNTSFIVYEDLSRSNDRYQYIFPKFNFSRNIDIPDNYNGSFTFESEGHNKNYNSNIIESVLINDFLYKSNDIVNNKGVLTNYSLFLKNSNSYADNSEDLPENTKYNLFETIKVDLSYPLQKKSEKFTNYIKPKASLKFSPNGNTNISGKDLKINYDNAFSLNRISENDQVEGGESLSLGFEYQVNNNIFIDQNLSSEIFKFRVGNILKLKEDNNLPLKSKLNKTRSDIFGDINLKLNEIIDIGYEFSYDKDLKYSNLDSINLSLGANNFVTTFNYFTENHDFGDSENITNITTFNIHEENIFKFKTTRNLRDDFTEYYDLVYEYLTDCLSINLNYNKTFYRAGSLEPDETISFLLKIIPFTQIGVENIQKLAN